MTFSGPCSIPPVSACPRPTLPVPMLCLSDTSTVSRDPPSVRVFGRYPACMNKASICHVSRGEKSNDFYWLICEACASQRQFFSPYDTLKCSNCGACFQALYNAFAPNACPRTCTVCVDHFSPLQVPSLFPPKPGIAFRIVLPPDSIGNSRHGVFMITMDGADSGLSDLERMPV
jgi:hypothetical protein